MQELEPNRFAGLRRVIDLSGDGRTNDGRPLRAVREEVIKHGITVNGLAILNELPLLDHYLRDQLIGGAGAFFMVARAPPAAGDLIRLPKLPHQPSRNRRDSAAVPINDHCVAAGFEICGDQ